MMLYKPIVRTFKENQHLNYGNVDFVTIKYVGYNKIKIENADDVNQIIGYLNSLELIEEGIPNREQAVYEGDWEKYENDLENIGYFLVSIDKDLLYFSTSYVTVMPDGNYWNRHSYYIRNSGYNKKEKNSNIYTFFQSITEKYT